MDCPFGLVYNWALDACDWPANLGCDLESSGLDGSGSGGGNIMGKSIKQAADLELLKF